MSIVCNHCQGSGFLNIHHIPDELLKDFNHQEVLRWISSHDEHDVAVCDCCGDGHDCWYGVPWEHYNSEDPMGKSGPYAYNGGLCKCH